MIDTQEKLFLALQHLYPDGFEGFKTYTTPTNYDAYKVSIKPGFIVHTEQELEDALVLEQEKLSRIINRNNARTELRNQWSQLPAWIRGPYNFSFNSVVELLNHNDDEAAEYLIRYIPPMNNFTVDQVNQFNTIRDQFGDAIRDLPKI